MNIMPDTIPDIEKMATPSLFNVMDERKPKTDKITIMMPNQVKPDVEMCFSFKICPHEGQE
jgi:hypothetical protein